MKKYLLVLFCLGTFYTSGAQLLTWSPAFPNDTSTLVITVDCSKGNQGLYNYPNPNNIYVHIGVTTNNSNNGGQQWLFVNGNTGGTWGDTNPALHATSLGNNKYQYTINNIRSFFGVPATDTIKKVAILFRDANTNTSLVLKQTNRDLSDMYIPVYDTTHFAVRLDQPPFEPRFVLWREPINIPVGGNINITGVSSKNASLTLKFNGTVINSASGVNTISASPTIATNCEQKIVLEGNDGTGLKKDSISFYIPKTNVIAALPNGVREGINYDPNNTSATLVLYAPNKNNVVVIGDFSNWAALCANQMNQTPDGNYYWLTLNGLTPGSEYAYQYLVDDNLKIADPYTQKILDPNNDQYIDATTYPNLKAYPAGLTSGIVSILQTAEPAYNWQVTNFTKPDKRNLMVYELLVRDFTSRHNYQSLIDSFNYFKNIGINAIELMPINEFDGNDSWGYNPDFYFAPDKYYGTKNKLKEFIDKCHQNGMAVILDVVYDHCTGNAPEAQLYWDTLNSRPAPGNPWLNPVCPHPYGVFNDFNHTSTATQYLVLRSLDFWLTEYKVDGYRFDLGKGFTQTQSNTQTVENYDASRVANLERYYDGTVPNHPNSYMIIEFLGTLPCQEEQEYANHGFMLWGNNNVVYNQCTMGFASNSDISPIVYKDPKKNYSNSAEVGYMESHDEERTMYKNLTYGNSSGSYNVTNLATALQREEAAATVFFTVPGPKMIWQFEERGYDIPLTYGGSNLADKPPHWEYMSDPNRKHLYNTYDSIIQLRLNNPSIFTNTSFSYDFYNSGGLYKLFQIADTSSNGKQITVVANLDVVQQTKSVTFQSTGNWKNYISDGTGSGINGSTGTVFNITTATQSITLQPGEYHIYVSIPSCTTAAPTATTPVNYCQNATATALTATGTNLLWYTAATGGTGSVVAPTPSTTTVGTTNYYVSQTIICEGPRFNIVVNIAATSVAPTVNSPVNYCQNATAIALTATGTNLLWYTTATGGTGSAVAPVPSTATAGSTNYYVSQTNGCGEGPRAMITVNVTPTPPAPTGLTALSITNNSATLNWSANSGNFYTADYKATSSNNWINVANAISTGSVNLTNLSASTSYDWRVTANCNNTVINNYTQAQFVTASHNSTISNLKDGFGIKISPDPLHSNALIDYIIPGSGSVTITLFNSEGQLLQVLFNSSQSSGQYQLQITNQFSSLSTDCYFIRLQQNGSGNYSKFIKQ